MGIVELLNRAIFCFLSKHNYRVNMDTGWFSINDKFMA